MENQRKTFLSYSRANKDFAIRLARELKAEGFQIWLDQLDIPAGARWDREVERALRDSEIFMIILTPASVDSENVLDEIGYAIDSKKRFLPVLLENCEIPLRLRRFQYVDFTNKSFDDGVESAKELLRSLSAQSTIPQGPLLGTQVQTDVERKAQEETDRLAALKAEEERLTIEKADLERRVKEEADRLAAQIVEEQRLAKQKEDVHAAKADILATQKAEEERLAKLKAEEELAANAQVEKKRKDKEETERLAAQKPEKVLSATTRADRQPKKEPDLLAAKKIEAIPVSATSVSTAQKKPIFKGLVIGIIAIVVLVIAGFGINAVLNRSAVVTDAPYVYVTRELIYYENDKYNPDLIESWEADSDQTVWTFHLSRDVILKNGDHLTSMIIEDYLSSKSIVRSEKAKVEIVDDFTFTVTLYQAKESQDLFKTLSEQGYICRQ